MFDKLSKTKREGRSDFVKIRRYSPKNGSKKIFFMAVFLILVVAAVGGIFLAFNGSEIFSGNKDDVAVKIQTSENVVSGENITFFISVYNNGFLDLAEADLTVDFPEGFYFQSAKPGATNQLAGGADWALQDIPKNNKKVIEITGQLLGGLGEKKLIQATLSYKMSDLSASFQKSASAEIEINSSTIGLEIKSPAKVLEDEKVSYEIELKNAGENILKNLRLTVDFPDDFIPESVEPEQSINPLYPDEQKNSWPIDKLQRNEKIIIKLVGHFSAGAGQFKELTVKVGAVDEAGNLRPLMEKKNLIFMIEPGLFVDFRINGRAENDLSADWEDALDGELIYENKGDLEIEDISLKVGLTDTLNKVLDRDKIQKDADDKFGIEYFKEISSENWRGLETVLSWNKEQEPALALLKPGDQGKIKFKIFIKPPPQPEQGALFTQHFFVAKTWAFGWLADFESKDLPKRSIQTEDPELQVKINSQIFLNVETNRLSGALYQGADGAYQIVWRLTNTTNQIKDLKISVVLPEGVEWADESRVNLGQNLQFDEQTKEVVWRLSQLPPFSGSLQAPAEASFKVMASPSVRRDDQSRVILTGDISLQAQDGFTAKNIFIQQGPAKASD